jgi:hypothetical protein
MKKTAIAFLALVAAGSPGAALSLQPSSLSGAVPVAAAPLGVEPLRAAVPMVYKQFGT